MTTFYYSMSEDFLLTLIAEGDQSALIELINRYEGKARSLAHEMYLTNTRSGVSFEDLKSVCIYTIYQSAKHINGRNIKFSSYYIKSAKRNMVRYINENSYFDGACCFYGRSLSSPTSQNYELPLGETLGAKDLTNEFLMHNEIISFVQNSKDFTPHEKQVFALYTEGYSFDEIKTLTHHCRSAIYKTINKVKEKLKEAMGSRYFNTK